MYELSAKNDRLREAAVAAFTGDFDVVGTDGGFADAGGDIDSAYLFEGCGMPGKHIVNAVHDAVFDQLLGAAGEKFFPLLEYEIDSAVDEFPVRGKDFGHGHEDCRMGIVAAGVHDAGMGALVGQVIHFRKT